MYMEHAGKAAMDLSDVRLAIQSRVNYSFTQPPPREVFCILFLFSLAFPSIPPPLAKRMGDARKAARIL